MATATMLSEFIEYLEYMCDRAIYVWGGQTEVIKNGRVYKDDTLLHNKGNFEAWIKKVEDKSSDVKRVTKLYNKRKNKFDIIPVADCSGLGMGWLYNKKKIASSDMTANGMKAKCISISKSLLKKGDWVFRVYTSGSNKGRAYHIGYVVDDDLNVIHAKGRDHGVVKESFSSKYWNHYGRPTYFVNEIENQKVDAYTFKRVLKRVKPVMSGTDVTNLQKLLNEVNDANLAVDGKFGPKTEKAVKAYQKFKKLKVDGKAGKNTITALGGIWVG